MKTVQKGDTISLSYRIVLEDGSIYETSELLGNLTFQVGESQVWEPLDTDVIGMKVGDYKAIKVTFDKAYGPKKDERIFKMPKSKAPVHFEVGKTVELYRADGQKVQVKIIGEDEETFVMDGNHPLAGHDLSFEVTLLSIE